MHRLHDLGTKISLWLAWLAGAVIIFGCAVPISIDVISRAVTGSTLVESFEISGYALAACIGLGMGYTVTTKANIRVDILVARLPRGLRMAADLAASMALAMTALALTWYTFDVLADSWRLDARSVSTLRVPLVIPQSVWWLGFVWFSTIAVLTPIYAISRLVAKDPAGFENAMSNAGLSDELEQIGMTNSSDSP